MKSEATYNIFPELDIRLIAKEAATEVISASKRFPPFNSAHEGYAVIKEELEHRGILRGANQQGA